MNGAYRTYTPITTDDLTTREAQLAMALGPAIRWQLWLFFEPGTFGGHGLAMPCDDLPRRPPADAVELLTTMLSTVIDHVGPCELIVGLERWGGPDPTVVDLAWMSAFAEACARASVPFRSVLISHTRGVREHSAPRAATPTAGAESSP